MKFDFLATKKSARQVLHETLGVSSKHISADTGLITDCTSRVHTRIQLGGDVDYQGFAELSEGVVLIHIPKEESNRLHLKAEDYLIYDDKVYRLNTQRDDDGIYLDSWFAMHLTNIDESTKSKLESGTQAEWLISEW